MVYKQAVEEMTDDQASLPFLDVNLVDGGHGVKVKQYQLPLGMLPGDEAYIDALRDIQKCLAPSIQ